MSSTNRVRFYLLALLAVFSALFPPMATAQFASGVEATVVDSTGAVVPGAEFVFINQETQVAPSAGQPPVKREIWDATYTRAQALQA